jgi:hypothetical protein
MQIKNGSILISILFLVACTTQPAPKILVTLSENQTLDFTGKGAAAGIMLDSVMGGAGIAIGIAIDKGIAKDIANNLNHHKPLLNIVDHLDQQLKAALIKNQVKGLQNIQATIEHYGFRTFPGGDDAVSAWLEISLLIDGRNLEIHYPQDFAQVDSASLSSVKENPDVTYTLLNNATAQVIKHVIGDINKL